MDILIILIIMGLCIFGLYIANSFCNIGTRMIAGFLLIIFGCCLFGGIEYKTGETEVYQYGDNYSGYHWDYETPNSSVDDVNIFHLDRENIYTSYNGIFLSSIALIFILFGLLLVIYRPNENGEGGLNGDSKGQREQ